MAETNDEFAGAQALPRRLGIWPGGQPCALFYDPQGEVPADVLPLIVRSSDGSLRQFEVLRGVRDRLAADERRLP